MAKHAAAHAHGQPPARGRSHRHDHHHHHEGALSSWLQVRDCHPFGPAGDRFVQRRPFFMALAAATNLTVLALAGLAPARLLLLSALVAVPLGAAVFFALHPKTRKLTPAALWWWLAVGSFFIATALGITGGVRSPLVPLMITPVITVVAVWRWTRAARMVTAHFVLGIVILYALPAWLTGPPIRSPHHELLLVVNLILCLNFGGQTVLSLSEGFTSTTRTLESVREQALEAATGRIRSLEQVGAKVAHELKNPLAAIKSLLQLESSGATDDRSRRRLDVMTREVARMEEILRDYLTFSRPLEDLRVGPVDLADIAGNVVSLLEGRAAGGGVRIDRSGGSVVLAGDGRRLEEAVLNLAANALEATPRGGSVELHVESAGADCVLRVRDSGAGMSAALLEKIGTPFFTTRSDGTGLGVVLARAVISQHGGRLDFQSQPGAGTTATIVLPSKLTMPAAAAATRAAAGEADGARPPG